MATNEQGWRSTRSSYVLENWDGVKRKAVGGDTCVHRAIVDRHAHLAAKLDRFLAERGATVEVCRFYMV